MRRFRDGALLLGIAIVVSGGCDGGTPTAAPTPATAAVRAGRLEVVVRARGSLQPQEELNIAFRQSGTITQLAEDGSLVREGQVIGSLDDSEVERELLDVTSELDVMQAELASLLADLNNRKSQAQAQVDEALRDLELARIRHENLVSGAHIDPSTRIAAREGLQEAKVTAGYRSRDLEVLDQLRARGVVTAEEYAQLAGEVEVLTASARAARAAFDRVLEGAEPGEVVEARLDVKLREYRHKISSQWLADLTKQEQEIRRRYKERIRRKRVQLVRLKGKRRGMTITAPADGVLLVKSFWGRKVGPGRRIWRGIPACSIAVTASMRLNLKVDGRQRATLEKGQSVAIEIDAIDERVFRGTVTSVGRFGRDAFEDLDSRTKEIVGDANRRAFDVAVTLAEDDPRLRPGMMANARIVCSSVEDALLVPREAIAREEGQPATVRVWSDGAVEERTVRLGAENRLSAVVLDGLRAGERVVIGG